jgi:hypothetical protein
MTKTIEKHVAGMCYTSVDDLRMQMRYAESTGHWPPDEAMQTAYANLVLLGYKTKAKVMASYMRRHGLKVPSEATINKGAGK